MPKSCSSSSQKPAVPYARTKTTLTATTPRPRVILRGSLCTVNLLRKIRRSPSITTEVKTAYHGRLYTPSPNAATAELSTASHHATRLRRQCPRGARRAHPSSRRPNSLAEWSLRGQNYQRAYPESDFRIEPSAPP